MKSEDTGRRSGPYAEEGDLNVKATIAVHCYQPLHVEVWNFQLIITTATCKNPSPNPAALPSSSRLALMGTTAPWSTGCASRGDRRLGKILDSTLFNAVPSVCGCFDGKRSGTRDWTTLIWPAFPEAAVASSSDAPSGIVCEVPWLADVGR